MEVRYLKHEAKELANLYSEFQASACDLVVDSRLVNDASRTVFFALTGQRYDGHQFIQELYTRGVRTFVIRDPALVREDHQEGICYVIDNPLSLLQKLAAHHRRQFPHLPVIAITGSNGKTIVKDWLAQVLSHQYRVCASPRSYNSQIGVPLSVWQLSEQHTLAVFEAGISQPGEMAALRDIIQPTRGVLTNIGTAHLYNFPGRTALVEEKLSLFQDCELVILPESARTIVAPLRSLSSQASLGWVDTMGEGRMILDGEAHIPVPTSTLLTGVYRQNALLVAAVANLLGVPSRIISEELLRLTPLTNRLERREGHEGNPIINDSYSNDFSALAAALTFAESQDPYGSLTLVLGEVQPLPNLPERLSALLTGRVSRLLLVGPGQQTLRTYFPEADYYSSPEKLLGALRELNFSGQTVLIKGSSAQQLQRVADRLSRQLHRTVLRVDLSALRHNYRIYREALPPGVRTIVMTKASAYGSGALPVARMLQQVGADYLAVAYPDEGRILRRGGITLPIMVLNAESLSFAQLGEFRLEPVIHTEDQLRRATEQQLPVHLELDTGMSRLGFRAGDFRALLRSALLPRTRLRTIFTHLAASEDAAQDDFTRRQLALFDELYADYLGAGYASVPRHALNSNGISRFTDAAYGLVRLGIGLYGIGDETRRAALQPALTLTTTITSIARREAEETIGYGRRGKLSGKRMIAVLSIGYADGLPRLAGEGRFSVKVRGQLAPTVGSICMDMCMVDVTEVPGTRVQDEVTIFGPEHPIELLAAAAQTIPYEILTGVGERVHRIYSGE